jgi:hypothetical protein
MEEQESGQIMEELVLSEVLVAPEAFVVLVDL